MTHMIWVIMRLRMKKRHQLSDPRFCIAVLQPLTDGALDLISGLDSRMLRLLLMPQAVGDVDFADPLALLDGASLTAALATFLDQHADVANCASWLAMRASSVLEIDLDSIADSHQCQSPVF